MHIGDASCVCCFDKGVAHIEDASCCCWRKERGMVRVCCGFVEFRVVSFRVVRERNSALFYVLPGRQFGAHVGPQYSGAILGSIGLGEL